MDLEVPYTIFQANAGYEMDAGKKLREAVDAISGEALDDAMNLVFGVESEHGQRSDDESSEMVGRYKLLEQIGEGGFGIVYMAEQQEPIRRRVALKIIKPGMDTKQVVARFEAERQALALMDHENIASVLDAGATESGRPYFVMELVRGVPITTFCDTNTIDTTKRLKLFTAVCQAVQHAHQKGIIHRDLKPTNVMVTLREGEPIPKVIDFGVAKATQMRLTERTLFTKYGQFIGTPAYMSPEQVEMSEHEIDTRSDIYSLGVLLYELLTGSTPVDLDELQNASYSDMQRMICQQDPPKPSLRLSKSGEALATISSMRAVDPQKLGHIVRGELDWIVMKALEKDRQRRYETANGLAADVDRYLHGEPVLAGPPTTAYVLRKYANKHRKLILVGLAFFIMLLAGTLVSTWLAIEAKQAAAEASQNEELANQRFDRAQTLSQELDHQLGQSRSLLYVAHMNLIQREFETGSRPRILELLNQHRPQAGERDLRCFAWYYALGMYDRQPTTWRHDASVRSAVIGSDGQTIISGRSDGQLHIRDMQSGRVISKIKGHANAINDVAIAPDGKLVATGGIDDGVKLWTLVERTLVATGKTLRCEGAIRHLTFSPNGTKLLVANDVAQIGTLKLWDVESGEHRNIDVGNDWAYGAAFSHDGAMLASGTVKTVHICDVATAKVIRRLTTQLPHVATLAYSPVDDTLAVGGTRGGVELWGPQDTEGHRLGSHADWVRDLVFSKNGRLLASASIDHLVMLWNVTDRKRKDVLRGHNSEVFSVGFSPAANSLISSSADSTVKLWDVRRQQSSATLSDSNSRITALQYSPVNDNLLFSGSEDGTLNMWDIAKGDVVGRLPSYGGMIRCIAASRDGKTIAYGGGTAENFPGIFLSDVNSKNARKTQHVRDSEIRTMVFLPDDETILSVGREGRICLFDRRSGEVKATHRCHAEEIIAAAVAPNGKQLAIQSGRTNTLAIWDIAPWQQRLILSGHDDQVTSLAFSPSGEKLASGSRDKSVRIWNLNDGRQEFAMEGHQSSVESVQFSPAGLALASVGRDHHLRLWNVATGQETTRLDCPSEMQSGNVVSFSAEATSLASASHHAIIVYKAPRHEQ